MLKLHYILLFGYSANGARSQNKIDEKGTSLILHIKLDFTGGMVVFLQIVGLLRYIPLSCLCEKYVAGGC